jgi:hypothetical protein
VASWGRVAIVTRELWRAACSYSVYHAPDSTCGELMALAIVVTLEKDLPGATAAYANAGTGKALARESDRLDSVAPSRGVLPLTALLAVVD